MSATAQVERAVRSFTVRGMVGPDCEDVLDLFDSEFGEGYVSGAELRKHALQDRRTASVAIGSGGAVLGAATGLLPDGGGWLAAIPADQRATVTAALPELQHGAVGILKSVAVASDARGNGVGAAVSAAVVESLAARGAASVLSIGWTDADGCHIERTLERLGFAARADVEDFWRQESMSDGYGCPTCGWPCRCTARLFTRPLAKAAGKGWG